MESTHPAIFRVGFVHVFERQGPSYFVAPARNLGRKEEGRKRKRNDLVFPPSLFWGPSQANPAYTHAPMNRCSAQAAAPHALCQAFVKADHVHYYRSERKEADFNVHTHADEKCTALGAHTWYLRFLSIGKSNPATDASASAIDMVSASTASIKLF